MPLPAFPAAKRIKGIGLSDDACYATMLAQKFSFTNTHYDRAPFFDITNPRCGRPRSFDFIIASEIFEHIEPPVQRAFDNLGRLLKSNGFVLFTVPWAPEGNTREHFPRLHDWKLVFSGGKCKLQNRTASGGTELFDDLCFHGGIGQNLEMRLFSRPDLMRHFEAAGFRHLVFCRGPHLEYGIVFQHPWSLPCVVRKRS